MLLSRVWMYEKDSDTRSEIFPWNNYTDNRHLFDLIPRVPQSENESQWETRDRNPADEANRSTCSTLSTVRGTSSLIIGRIRIDAMIPTERRTYHPSAVPATNALTDRTAWRLTGNAPSVYICWKDKTFYYLISCYRLKRIIIIIKSFV